MYNVTLRLHFSAFRFQFFQIQLSFQMSRIHHVDYKYMESNTVFNFFALSLVYSTAKWWRHTIVTGSCYCCYAPVLHWFCVVIGSIVVQDSNAWTGWPGKGGLWRMIFRPTFDEQTNERIWQNAKHVDFVTCLFHVWRISDVEKIKG